MTVDEFNIKIIRPSILQSLKLGALDDALLDPDCIEFLMKDKELWFAAIERMKIILDERR